MKRLTAVSIEMITDCPGANSPLHGTVLFPDVFQRLLERN